MILRRCFRKATLLASIALVSFLSLACGQETSILYSLPAFSMILQVQKSDNALILFQDRLENAIRAHLVAFFTGKVNTEENGYGMVKEIGLSSQMFWRELEEGNDPSGVADGGDALRRYEVRASFESRIELYMDIRTASASLSQPIMELLFVEAFQGDNYWQLYHLFLSDTELDQIDDVEISVMANGFRPFNAQGTEFSYGGPSSNWTISMKIGVAFASFFVCVLAIMWIYLCIFVRGTCLFRKRRGQMDEKSHESVTDPNSSDMDGDHLKFGCEPEFESAWMDAWATAITSIPLREPKKGKKKKVRRLPRPSQQYTSQLFQIAELEGDDNCTIEEDRERNGDRILAFDPETCTALVSYQPSSREIVEYQRRELARYEYKYDERVSI